MTTIHDDTLGTMTFNAEWESFEGMVSFDNQQVKVTVRFSSSPDNVSEADKIKARTIYLNLVSRKAAFEAEIIAEFLPLYNDIWRGDEPLINQDQFMKEIKLVEIVIYVRTEQVSIYYDTGDLFSYHMISVYFDSNGNISRMSL